MAEITLKLTDDELKALEELAKLEGRNAVQQAAHIIHEDLQARKFIKSDVNESQDGRRIIRLDE
jgi:hypothetical protein